MFNSDRYISHECGPGTIKFYLQGLLWIHCPGSGGVRDNENADLSATINPVVDTVDNGSLR